VYQDNTLQNYENKRTDRTPNNDELKSKKDRRTEQIKRKTKKNEQEQNHSETDAMVNIVTPCSSLHQILNYRLFPICRFTDEVGNMQRLLKPTLQLHSRRLPRAPHNCLKLLLPYLRSKYTLYGTCPVAFSIHKITYSDAAASGLVHPRRFARHRFSNMKQSNSRSNPYLLLCMKCDVAEMRN
jgi:hypothetical protein